jgi:hypothetical protein
LPPLCAQSLALRRFRDMNSRRRPRQKLLPCYNNHHSFRLCIPFPPKVSPVRNSLAAALRSKPCP